MIDVFQVWTASPDPNDDSHTVGVSGSDYFIGSLARDGFIGKSRVHWQELGSLARCRVHWQEPVMLLLTG